MSVRRSVALLLAGDLRSAARKVDDARLVLRAGHVDAADRLLADVYALLTGRRPDVAPLAAVEPPDGPPGPRASL